jgi:Nucleotidyl transferase of unknown function (DUF2204)
MPSVPSAPSPAELLADLAEALAALGVPWYVFGAQAALIWGRPRLTTDVDVTVRLGGTDSTALVEALRAYGFTLRLEATEAFVRQTRVLPLQHDRSGLALDIVLGGPGLEDLFLSRAVAMDVAGVTVPFISPEDLIVTKILAGRAKDIEDVRGVLAERGEHLGIGQIEQTLAMIEEALGQSDLRPLFEAELARWRTCPR